MVLPYKFEEEIVNIKINIDNTYRLVPFSLAFLYFLLLR